MQPLVQSPSSDSLASLLNVKQVAAMLCCSPRHVYRLSDRGAMPRPVKLGDVLVRWSRSTGDPATGIEDWIAGGCKPVRAPGKVVRA